MKNLNRIIQYKLLYNIIKIIPARLYLKMSYRWKFGRSFSLNSPTTFNQKLQYLKIHDHNPMYTNLVDKYEVRKYIKETIGEKYLVPLFGVYDSPEEIDYSELPAKFVLKPTHTSGNVIICREKRDLDIENTNRTIRKWLKKNYYWYQREWPYKNIKPKIICEELLVDELQGELIDYKIMCFNGEPRCLFLCLERGSKDGLKVDFYDLDWTPLPFERHYPRSNRTLQKPTCLNEMLELSKTLSKGIPFVRVDFYIVNKKIKFSELTFFPGSGMEEFTPESYDYLLGSWLDLSKVKSTKSSSKSL